MKNMSPVQDLEHDIPHLVHHRHCQPNHNRHVVDNLEVILNLTSVCLTLQTFDQTVALPKSTLKLDLKHRIKLMNIDKHSQKQSQKVGQCATF